LGGRAGVPICGVLQPRFLVCPIHEAYLDQAGSRTGPMAARIDHAKTTGFDAAVI
jgi:hypothetical protein